MNEEQLDHQNILQFIWTKRKTILFVTTFAAVISLVISFFITPLYLSSAIVFPAATSTVSFSEGQNTKASSMDFGNDENVEQLLQILNSYNYHIICLNNWIKECTEKNIKPTCPVCRNEMVNIQYIEETTNNKSFKYFVFITSVLIITIFINYNL
jgi:capsular polysaccharide biosynthesis protein